MSIAQYYEQMLFSPKWYHVPLILLLLPLSLLYGSVMFVRRLLARRVSYGIPILSIGNLMVGGSGKTPFTIALAQELEGVCIISRGYGRQSVGMVEVSYRGEICCDVYRAGDEAMLMASSLPSASVLVSEDRPKAIAYAKERGAKVILLDDGFNRVGIEKFEILLEPAKIHNMLPFPAGALREFSFSKRYGDMILKEQRDFTRVVEIVKPTERMLLVTAISNPSRLDPYLPEGIVGRIYLEDHAYFDIEAIEERYRELGASSLLCTSKDRVKLDACALPVTEMLLKLDIDNGIIEEIKTHTGY